MQMDKETKEGMKSLELTAHASDIAASASARQNAEIIKEQQAAILKENQQ